MIDLTVFGVFLGAAIVLAVTPGAGLFYIMTRSLKGGRTEGINSAFGTAVGGMFHVFAAAVGISGVIAASALAFNLVKYLGAAYLIYLGIKTIVSRENLPDEAVEAKGRKRVFLQGITVEALNPKTALFFLAFIPQFIDPVGDAFFQILLLGSISVFLNTSAAFLVACSAGAIGKRLKANPKLRARQRYVTGTGLIALGGYVALTGNRKA